MQIKDIEADGIYVGGRTQYDHDVVRVLRTENHRGVYEHGLSYSGALIGYEASTERPSKHLWRSTVFGLPVLTLPGVWRDDAAGPLAEVDTAKVIIKPGHQVIDNILVAVELWPSRYFKQTNAEFVEAEARGREAHQRYKQRQADQAKVVADTVAELQRRGVNVRSTMQSSNHPGQPVRVVVDAAELLSLLSEMESDRQGLVDQVHGD